MATRTDETKAFLRALGAIIRAIRKERGLHQEHVGKLAGMSGSRIGEMERGLTNPSTEKVARVAGALGVTVAALLRRVEVAGQGEGATATMRAGILRALRRMDAADLDLVATLVARLMR